MGRVLVVEDDPLMQRCLQLFLSKEGYEADGSSSVEEARVKLLADRYELVITDYQLHGQETGLDLIQFLSRSQPGVPSVMISASSDPHLPSQALRQGAFAFMPKPIDLDAIVGVCREASSLRRRDRAAWSRKQPAYRTRYLLRLEMLPAGNAISGKAGSDCLQRDEEGAHPSRR